MYMSNLHIVCLYLLAAEIHLHFHSGMSSAAFSVMFLYFKKFLFKVLKSFYPVGVCDEEWKSALHYITQQLKTYPTAVTYSGPA